MSVLPQPSLLPPGEWHFPTPRHDRLSNGIEVLTYDLPGQHVISAHLVLDVPLSAEQRPHEGVATITTRALDEGSRSHPGEEFAELLEAEGAGFGIDVTLAGLQAVLDVPASRLEPALKLFAEAVTEPALADADVNRHVQLRLAEIEQAFANSAQAANIAFRSAVYNPESRAARMNGGEPGTIAGLTPDVVRDFHATHFGPRKAVLIFAGEFAQDPVALAEAALGGWANPDQAQTAQPTVSRTTTKSVLVHRPGAVQADLRLGGFAVDRRDPRWADVSVASYAMGGAFLSRLNAVLREERGYTYGVRMNFSPLRSGGSYSVQGSFRTDVMVDALVEARELLKLTGKPITEQELADAVNFFVGVTPLRYATADGVTDQAGMQVLMGLEDDWVDRSLAALRSVTPESATAAYESLVDLDDLTLVLAGDADVLAEPLRAAGYTDLEVRD